VKEVIGLWAGLTGKLEGETLGEGYPCEDQGEEAPVWDGRHGGGEDKVRWLEL
jgi:hypothetical protein